MGNRGEALRVFGKLPRTLQRGLGADPSQETERVFLEILRAGSDHGHGDSTIACRRRSENRAGLGAPPCI